MCKKLGLFLVVSWMFVDYYSRSDQCESCDYDYFQVLPAVHKSGKILMSDTIMQQVA